MIKTEFFPFEYNNTEYDDNDIKIKNTTSIGDISIVVVSFKNCDTNVVVILNKNNQGFLIANVADIHPY